jgi:hypothetical protein
MAVFLWYLVLSVAVALGAYSALASTTALPASPVVLAIAAGYGAGAIVFLLRCLFRWARRSRTERMIRRSWWTPDRFASDPH